MKTPKIHIRQSQDGQYYFTLNAKNGKVRATSEMYKEKRKALAGAVGMGADFGFEGYSYPEGVTLRYDGYYNPIPIIDHTSPAK